MESVKPGTRCECQGCDSPDCRWMDERDCRCESDAVRMVTVREPGMEHVELDAPSPDNYGYKAAPMCAACAEYHEGGAK